VAPQRRASAGVAAMTAARPTSGNWLVFGVWVVAAVGSSRGRYLEAFTVIPDACDFRNDFVAVRWQTQGKPIAALDNLTADRLMGRRADSYTTDRSGSPYPHPPPAALPVLPLLPLGMKAAIYAWFALSLAALAILARLLLGIWRCASRLPRWRETVPLGLALFLWPPTLFNFAYGQWSVFLATLVAAGWWDLACGRRRRAFWFGAAIAFKTTPAVIGGYLALRSRRTAVGVGLVFVAFAVLAWPLGGLAAWRYFFSTSGATVREWEAFVDNTVSIDGVFARLLIGGQGVLAPFHNPPLAHALTAAVAVLLVAVAVWLTRQPRGERRLGAPADGPAFALWAALIPLLNPLACTHNAVFLLLPAALVARDGVPAARNAVGFGLVLLSIPRETFFLLARDQPFPASRGWVLGLHALGALAIFAGAAVAARATRAKRTEGEGGRGQGGREQGR
jgi:glycosyl transferase family 87